MPKFRQRYRAPVEGEKIPLSEATYQRLKTAAFANRCTIGQWCESHLQSHLRLRTNYPAPKTKPALVVASKKERSFEIHEGLLIEIEMYMKDSGRSARQWIGSTILHCLAIEEERLRGVREQPDRFG